MKFSITGKIGLEGQRPFTKKVEAKSEQDARDKVYALFGSQNRLKRSAITIEKVTKG